MDLASNNQQGLICHKTQPARSMGHSVSLVKFTEHSHLHSAVTSNNRVPECLIKRIMLQKSGYFFVL